MSKTNDLILPLKKRWFDMIASGEKKEEYREITPYWCVRLMYAFGHRATKEDLMYFTPERIAELWTFHESLFHPRMYSKVEFTLGYPKAGDTARRMTFNNPKIRIGTGRPEWGAEDGKKYFVITWDKTKEI